MIEAAKSYKSDFNGNTRKTTFSRIAEAFGIDGINHPVLLLDGNVRVLAANPKACEPLSRKQSEINGCLLGKTCIGNISEIFDAEPPLTPRGCISQAWSVAEVLRACARTRPGK